MSAAHPLAVKSMPSQSHSIFPRKRSGARPVSGAGAAAAESLVSASMLSPGLDMVHGLKVACFHPRARSDPSLNQARLTARQRITFGTAGHEFHELTKRFGEN